ncbi:hypothetical protein T484DRAFT_1754984 [Baffinella frigidus]|nr:hypothetical protein T484DRAFT_1754984 [Cryptophyta sp. CCMP2293]
MAGVAHPPTIIVTSIHLVNLLVRLVVLSTGVVTLYTYGWPRSPVLSVMYHSVHDGVEDDVAPLICIVIPVVWCMSVVLLCISDVARCILIATYRWHTLTNGLDLVWFGTTGLALPVLVCCVAAQLGITDLFMLLLLGSCMVVASVCELCAEELNTLVHMETVVSNEEVRRTVVWTLRHIHNVNLFVVLLVAVFPSVYEMGVHQQMPALSGKTMLLFLLIGLIVMLIFNQLCTHSLLVELAATRDDGRSVMPCSSRQNSSEYIPTIPPVQFPPVESARGRRYEQEDDADADPFNVESSERIFNDVYGCESYEDPDVHAVDNKRAFRVISVNADKVTVSFTDTIKVHHRSSCLRGTVYSSGVPIRPLGSRTPACETDSDGDGVGYRRTVGLLIEWRRCYMLNMVINALLVVSIVDMTSVLDPWWSAL